MFNITLLYQIRGDEMRNGGDIPVYTGILSLKMLAFQIEKQFFLLYNSYTVKLYDLIKET